MYNAPSVPYMFLESKQWSNIAFNQPVWASTSSAFSPISYAVDDDVTTNGQTISVELPFLMVDLGSNVPVGIVSLRFAEGT